MRRNAELLLTVWLVALAVMRVDSWLCQQPHHLSRRFQKIATANPSRRRRQKLHSSQDEASSSGSSQSVDITGKNIYQRIFYRLSPFSEVEYYSNLVVEERVRFLPDPDKGEGYLKPVGPRTLILRDGNVEEGDIGDELFQIDVKESMAEDATHAGAGRDRAMEATIAMVLFLAASPKYVEGNVLEVGSGLGLAGLLGCIGAGALKAHDGNNNTTAEAANESSEAAPEPEMEDILTIPKATPLTDELKLLTLSDEREEMLDLAAANVQLSNVPAAKVSVEQLPWRTHWKTRIRGTPKLYHTIIASDLDYNYLEAKELAHTVAFRLDSLSKWELVRGESKSPPTFVHLCLDAREDVSYLHKFLTKGFKMTVNTGYVKLEKLLFVYQMLPEDEPEEKLDDLELEVQEFKETVYQSVAATHHPEYADGEGDYFFPIENGEMERGSDSTYMEPDTQADRPKWY